MRKPRSDSTWDRLTEQRQAEVWDWLDAENLSYEAALARARERWGIASSVSALARWRSCYAQEMMLRRIAASAERANAVTRQFAENPSNTYDALLQMIGQAAFEAKFNGGTDLDLGTLKDLAELTGLGLKARKDTADLDAKQRALDLAERRVKLLETKAAQADRAASVLREELSPEEKEQRIKAVFGM
jgi:hypothetical protein